MTLLVVRNDGLGDLLLTLPTLAALRRAHPEAKLAIVVRPDNAAILDLYPDTVEVWCDDASARTRLREHRPDVVLFLKPDPGWAKAAFLARVPRRIGTRRRWQSLLFNERVPVRRRNSGRHEAECNGLVASPLGVTLPLPAVRLRVPPQGDQRAVALLARLGLSNEQFVVVHPGSQGSSPNWPAASYAELVEQLTDSGVHVIVTSGPRELDLAKHVAGAKGKVPGAVDLVTLAGLLACSQVVVSGSTRPMHLASPLGRPVVALFSARPPHTADRWGPWGGMSESSVVLESAPVSHGNGEDLSGLSTSQVLQAVLMTAGVGRPVP